MYKPHDQFTKELLGDALVRAGDAETEVPVPSTPPQSIDVYCVPDPERDAERDRMGLLGELVVGPTMFEPFHGTPNLERVRACLRKQLTWHHHLELRAVAAVREAARTAAKTVSEQESAEDVVREAAAENTVSLDLPLPTLVVVSPGQPKTVLRGYGCQRERDKRRKERAGLYLAPPELKLRIVVLAELPRTQETLLLRLAGSGRVLGQALDDLKALPDDAWEKSVAEPLLLHYQVEVAASATNEEDTVSAEIQAWYEDYQRKQQELREEALRQRSAETQVQAVLTVLRVRGIAVPESARERILAEGDLERLERWHERAIVASSVGEVFDESS